MCVSLCTHMPLLQIIYMSNLVDNDEAQIAPIVESARRNNSKNEITGMLLYSAGHFMQVLEGDPAAVKATFDVIRQDPRHDSIFILDELRVGRREFGAWSMGYHQVTSLELRSQPDLAALFEIKAPELSRRVAPGIAHAVLKSFGDGSLPIL